MFSNKIKIDKDLLERAKKCAEIAGYASVEEFIGHIIEKEVSKINQDGDSQEEIKKKLQGLGYIS